jgi:hypothetical protein
VRRFPKAVLNYIDTDHLFDRVRDEKGDYNDLRRANLPLLYDAGTNDSRAEKFETAFDVIRRLNLEIRNQNEAIDRTGFPARAAKNWLDLHEKPYEPIPTLHRALPTVGPKDRQWSADDHLDQKLLPLLNRYCFRCHSSVKYHVFDKEAVWQRTRSGIVDEYVEDGTMPQDRKMPEADRKALLELLAKWKVKEGVK